MLDTQSAKKHLETLHEFTTLMRTFFKGLSDKVDGKDCLDVRVKSEDRYRRPKSREDQFCLTTEQMESAEAEISHHRSRNLDEDEHCNNVPKIQEDNTQAGDGTRQHCDPHQGYRVRTVWRRWICFWLRRRYRRKTFTNLQCENNQPSAGGGQWQRLSCRHLLLLLRSRHPHVAAGDQLHTCHSATVSSGPGCDSVSVGNGRFLEDEEPGASRYGVYGKQCFDGRRKLWEELFSRGRGRNKETDVLLQIGTQMKRQCWERLHEEAEELLAEENGGESVYKSHH